MRLPIFWQNKGNKVTILEMLGQIGNDMGLWSKRVSFPDLSQKESIWKLMQR